MSLAFAIDQLYASGWEAIEPKDCQWFDDGRAFPSISRVAHEFHIAGYTLVIRNVQLFDCYRAEWHDENGVASGAVVGSTECEAAVYALAQLRRNI
jgi:hypothetical protein